MLQPPLPSASAGTPNPSSTARCVVASASPCWSCCPCTSTSIAPTRRSSATPTGWSLIERARPSVACPTIAPQHQLVAILRPARAPASSAAHRMIGRRCESTRSPPPASAPAPHQPGFGTPAQGQSQPVQQDRLAGAGLAGEHGETAHRVVRSSRLDQHHVAQRQARQHRGSWCKEGRGRCSRTPRPPWPWIDSGALFGGHRRSSGLAPKVMGVRGPRPRRGPGAAPLVLLENPAEMAREGSRHYPPRPPVLPFTCPSATSWFQLSSYQTLPG